MVRLGTIRLGPTHVPYPQLLKATFTFSARSRTLQHKTAQFFKKRLSNTVSTQKDKKIDRFIRPYRLHPQSVLLYKGYSVFQGFSKAKSANGGSILSSSQFLILPQLPQKIKLASKVVKDDSKIIILLLKI
jgi:hypothetical protein